MSIRESLRLAAAAARNVLLGANLASITLARRPNRLVHYASESLFLYREMSGRRGLPSATVQEAFGNGRRVTDLRLADAPGAGWLDELPSYTVDLVSLCMICRLVEPRTVFEIGTLSGYSAYHLALNSPDDAVIHTLDLPRDGSRPALRTTVVDDAHVRAWRGVAGYCFEGSDVARKIRLHEGDSATFDFSPWQGRVDLFFIDGAHSYDYVRSDTDRALACCRPGGVIVWHDFGRFGVNGVTRRLLELRSEGHDVRAVPGGSLAFLRIPLDGAVA